MMHVAHWSSEVGIALVGQVKGNVRLGLYGISFILEPEFTALRPFEYNKTYTDDLHIPIL